ncbi:hypothetical protein [Thalassobius sp. I31.1]|uniref:hypothetical protein n=1 Tax=Thalassobius sp. I31.1 TaxID=2109912 RepID=UPI0013009628|nr:hypothetical protein [Thalassobius sp. I31.1]
MKFSAARQDDERLLHMVRMRANGQSISRLAAHFGVSRPSITMQTNKIMDADLAESGEARECVSGCYWQRKA